MCGSRVVIIIFRIQVAALRMLEHEVTAKLRHGDAIYLPVSHAKSRSHLAAIDADRHIRSIFKIDLG